MDTEAYNRILSAEIGGMVFFFILFLALGGVLPFIFIHQIKKNEKKLKHERIDTLVSFILVLCVIVGALTAIVFHTVPYILDVREGAYVTYEGDFAVENNNDRTRLGYKCKPLLSFGGEKHQTQFELGDDLYLEDGFHDGTVIYSRRSHVIVEWHCDACEEQP